MSRKDSEMRAAIENILESDSPGQGLKKYFGGLPDKSLRRAISVLSGIYPDKTAISDDEFSFVLSMFSDRKFMGQESFFAFVSAVNIVNFTEHQKKLLLDTIKNNIELLCGVCTFELDTLLGRLLEPNALLQYLEVLIETGSRPALHHAFDILLYEDFSNSSGTDEKIETLKLKISRSANW